MPLPGRPGNRRVPQTADLDSPPQWESERLATLRETLEQGYETSFEDLYGSEGCTFHSGDQASPQMCNDAVDSVDVTVTAVGPFHWINRPTFQLAVQYQSGR